MVMQAKTPGWSSSPFDPSLNPNDAWERFIYSRYAGRTDDIIAFQQNRESEMGRMQYTTPGISGANDWMGSGAVAFRAPRSGGGSSRNDPGGYNWDTLQNSVENVGNAAKWAFNTGIARRASANKQQEQENKQQEQENAQRLGNFIGQTMSTSRNLQAGLAAKSGINFTGKSSPIKTPPPGINLLTNKAFNLPTMATPVAQDDQGDQQMATQQANPANAPKPNTPATRGRGNRNRGYGKKLGR